MNNSWKDYLVSDVYKVRDERVLNDKKIQHFSLTVERGIAPKTERYERDFLVKDINQKKYKVVYPNDLVFNPPNLRYGAIARSNIDYKVILSPSYEIFKTDLNKFCPTFLEYLFC